MVRIFILLMLSIASLTIATGCKEGTAAQVTVITPVEFQQAMKRNKQLQLVDVRTSEEFRTSHLQDAQNICVTDANFKEKAEALDKNKPVYVYCRKGGRSARAAEILTEMGFTEVYDLQGGLTNWESQGLETEK